jgi:hypothetical protein
MREKCVADGCGEHDGDKDGVLGGPEAVGHERSECDVLKTLRQGYQVVAVCGAGVDLWLTWSTCDLRCVATVARFAALCGLCTGSRPSG